MPDDFVVRQLRYRKKVARRKLDHLMMAWLSLSIAEHRLDAARARFESVIIDYHHEGTTVSEIAQRTHISRAAVYKILHKHNALESNTHKKAEDISHAS